MALTYLVDIAVGAIACCVTPLVIAQRWHQQIPWELAMHGICFLCFLSMVIFPWRCQAFYHRHRTTIVLSVKGATVLLPIVRSQVRLNQPATGYWLRDFMNASIGLRLTNLCFTGLLSFPWMLWVLQQLYMIVGWSNLKADCSSQLLTHPIMVDRIFKLHQGLRLLTTPLVPQAGMLVPNSPEGQCKAAVSFMALLLALLLPALLLVQPRPAVPRPLPPRLAGLAIFKWADRRIEQLLHGLRFSRGFKDGVVTWWLVVIVLWAMTALPFS